METGEDALRTFAFAFVLSLIALPACAETCTPIPGSDALWAKPETRFILVGEIHGTREQPAIFGDLVCAAAAAKRPIVVAIEHGVSEQPALDRFMASTGDAEAVRVLLADPWWSGEIEDGRESEAYLALIEDLRRLKAEGRLARLIAIDTQDDNRDEEMATRILAAGQGLNNPLTLVFSGNAHAAKIPHHPQSPRGAASYLPGNETVSLLLTYMSGTAWNCQQSCAANPNGATTDKPRGITFGRAWLPGYDGELSTGAPSTASPPAMNQPKRQ